jgi:large subunit ribosomal protein L4
MADNETTTFQASAFTGQGAARDKVALPTEYFDGTINMPVMHQAVKTYLANQRQGTAATKIRKYVTGGNQKPWRQKGTGRARQGSTRAPQWVGGGTVFGPTPRSYRLELPKQMKALARKSAFNARAREDSIFVIDALTFAAPKTSQMQTLVNSLGVGDAKVLLLTNGLNNNVYLSARNIPNVHVMPYGEASTYHILWSDVVLVEAGAFGEPLESVAGSKSAPRAAKVKKVKAAKADAESAPAKKTAAKKTVAKAKPAAKKAAAAKSPAKKPAAKKSAAKAAPKKKKGGK